MSERGRSKLFGRPGELLVEETAPRILMPEPPPRGSPGLEEPRADMFPEMFASDEEPSLPSGPLRVFVGPPSPMMETTDGGPPLRLAVPGGPPATPSRADSGPGAFLDDAVGELGDILGRRIPASRAPSRGPSSDPHRTELPVIEARTPRSRRPSDDDHLRTELPTFDVLGTPPPREAPTPGVALPTGDRSRSRGIPTAAARVRAAAAPPPAPGGYDDEATSIDPSPFQIFERPRPRTEEPVVAPRASEPRASEPRGNDAPLFDDPRFRKADPAEISFGEARVPPRAPFPAGAPFDRVELEEATNPGMAAPPSLATPVAASAPVAMPTPAAAPAPAPVDDVPVFGAPSAATLPPPPPEKKSVAPSPASRRRLVVLGGIAAAVLLGALAWQWNLRNPGAFARIGGGGRPVATTPAPRLDGHVPTTAAPDGAASAAPAGASVPEAVVPVPVEEAPIGAPHVASASDAVASDPVASDPATRAADASTPTAAAPDAAPASGVPAAILPAAAAASGAPAATAPPTQPESAPPPPAAEKSAAPTATKATSGAASAAAAQPEWRGGFEPPTGLLQVVCGRKAAIYVDDVRKGTSDGPPLKLDAGTHRLRTVANGYSRTQEVRVDANELNQVQCGIR